MPRSRRPLAAAVVVGAALSLTALGVAPAHAEGAPTKEVYIQNNGSHLCLSSLNGSTADGTAVVMYKCEDFDTQYWKFFAETYKGKKVFEIRQDANGKCLTTEGSQDFVDVTISRCEPTVYQYWTQGTNVFDGGQDIVSVPNKYGGAVLVPHTNSKGIASREPGAHVEVGTDGGDIDNSWSYT